MRAALDVSHRSYCGFFIIDCEDDFLLRICNGILLLQDKHKRLTELGMDEGCGPHSSNMGSGFPLPSAIVCPWFVYLHYVRSHNVGARVPLLIQVSEMARVLLSHICC